MTRVVLAACEKATDVSVIDLTVPATPKVVPVEPKLQGTGYTVALAGSLGVIGAYEGAVIKFQTISLANPAVPDPGVPIAIPIRISGVGAIAIESTHSHVAIGERTGGRVLLFDIDSGTPMVSETTDVNPITSICFYGPKQVAVAGGESRVWLIDFTGPSPQIRYISPALGSNLTVGCAPGLVAVGAGNNPDVELYETSEVSKAKATVATGLSGVRSLGLSGEHALCGAPSGELAAAVDFANRRAETFAAKVGSGALASREGLEGVCGGALTSDVALFEFLTGPPSPMSPVVNSGIPSVQSIGLGSF